MKTPAIPEADNSRRDNEEIKGHIADMIEHKEYALKEALALIEQARKLMNFRHAELADPIYEKASSAVWRAKHEVETALQFNFSGDTYLGNKACGPVGAAILRDMQAGILTKDD